MEGPPARRHACAVMSVLPNHDDSDPERFLSSGKYPHDHVHPYVTARLASACARRVLDVRGATRRAEPPAFHQAGSSTVTGHARQGAPPRGARRPLQAASRRCVRRCGFLRIHGMSDAEVTAAAGTLDLPLTLTMRGCIIYATKAP